ncbi:hypothetical protein V500_03855 [Pseudogymnoascus sp. VKM F-4518 (FW-2643)]|nr:hypothetical protein V500_03855 [Pseudogymnoascus sp. VKM F-4518 (FW-2643)]
MRKALGTHRQGTGSPHSITDLEQGSFARHLPAGQVTVAGKAQAPTESHRLSPNNGLPKHPVYLSPLSWSLTRTRKTGSRKGQRTAICMAHVDSPQCHQWECNLPSGVPPASPQTLSKDDANKRDRFVAT